MDFASEFVLKYEEVEYECISDDEFHGGMELSGSSSGDDSDDETESSRKRSPKKLKGAKKHHWRLNKKFPLTSTDAAAAPAPAPANAKRWFKRADTNVVSVSFNTLMSPCSMHAGDPVICSTCHAILSHISKPSSEGDSMVWKCEFCGNSMSIDIVAEEIPQSEEVTFLMEPGQATASSTTSGRDESLVVFCVDTSGSMCVTSEVDGKIRLRGTKHLQRLDSFNTEGGSQYLPSQKNHNVTYVSRLQAMQAAVEHQLGEMARNFPHRRVALVTFSNDVSIVGDGYQEEITVAGDKLLNMEELAQIGSKVSSPQAIHKSCKKLGEKVYRLEEGGATALGPALVVAVNMASSQPGSKVIVCTDGKANIGLGNLEESADSDAGTEFYTTLGNEALSKGVSVSVTTIQGTDCKLVHLGQLADKTGGQVNIVDPLNLTKEFGNILADQIIATNVKSKFLVHKALYVVNENDPSSKHCLAEFNPGNVQSSTTITFEFARKNTKDPRDKTKDKSGASTEEPVYDNKEDTSPAVYDNKTPNPEPAAATDKPEGGEEVVTGACSIVVHHPPEEGEGDRVEGEESDAVSEFPFQLQIEYTDTEGTKALRVITRSLPATADRQVAESSANLQVLGTHAAKKSADLALQGEYSKSRGKALMNQRLAWRSSHTGDEGSTEKKSVYRNIYTRIKTMENQLQRKQTREIMSRGCTYSDDEDIEAEELDDTDCDFLNYDLETRLAPEQMPRAAVAATASGLAPDLPPRAKMMKKRKQTKHSERSVDMEDSFANMVYEFRRASHRDIAGQQYENSSASQSSEQPPRLPARKYKAEEAKEAKDSSSQA